MNTDMKEEAEDGFTEVQVEMSEELYHQALAAAQEKGCTLDEWVAELLREEIRRRAMEAPGTPEILTTEGTDKHGCVDAAVTSPTDGKREVGK